MNARSRVWEQYQRYYLMMMNEATIWRMKPSKTRNVLLLRASHAHNSKKAPKQKAMKFTLFRLILTIFMTCMIFSYRCTHILSRESRRWFSNTPFSAPKGDSLVICGPSGTGKGTLINRLLSSYPQLFAFSVSHTSRAPRPGEIDGFHYHFRSLEYIQQDIHNGSIPYIEHANVHGNLYGTRQDAVDSIHLQGKVCILDLDVKGVQQLRALSFPARYLFIQPPQLEDLEKRLRGRQTESEESIRIRLQNARREMEHGRTAGAFDHVLVNREIEQGYADLVSKIKEFFPKYFA